MSRAIDAAHRISRAYIIFIKLKCGVFLGGKPMMDRLPRLPTEEGTGTRKVVHADQLSSMQGIEDEEVERDRKKMMKKWTRKKKSTRSRLLQNDKTTGEI